LIAANGDRATAKERRGMRQLFETFGNPSAVQRAIEAATPNDEKIQEAIKRLDYITKELQKLKASRQRILDWSVKGTISDEDAEAQLEKLKEREQKWNDERTRLDDELAHLPSKESIKIASKMIAGEFRQHTNARVWAKTVKANYDFEGMTWKERRALCEIVFSGETVDGRRMGIWISWDKTGKKWRYQIEGHLIEASGPIDKKWFVFGAVPLQKKLVAESAWH
jgi:hypothetical protein